MDEGGDSVMATIDKILKVIELSYITVCFIIGCAYIIWIFFGA